MTGIAFAADPAAGASAASGMMQFIPLILIFVVFYFLLIRPQQKQAKKHQQFLADLKKGQKVVTRGGIHAMIVAIDGNVLTLEIAKDVTIKASRDAIAGGLNKEGGVEVETKDAKPSGG